MSSDVLDLVVGRVEDAGTAGRASRQLTDRLKRRTWSRWRYRARQAWVLATIVDELVQCGELLPSEDWDCSSPANLLASLGVDCANGFGWWRDCFSFNSAQWAPEQLELLARDFDIYIDP